MFIKSIYFLMFVLCITIESKPLDDTIEYSNRILSDKKENREIIKSKKTENVFDNRISSMLKRKGVRNVLNSGLERQDQVDSDSLEDDIRDTLLNGNDNKKNTTMTTTNTTNILTAILESFIQKLKFSPQTFFQDRLGFFKEALDYFGITLPNNAPKGKQILNASGLIHLAGLDDNGFYTNRFQPAGFLGGNGWFANKGGLLGGPGAILSTGSLLTDYPTSYKKKK